MNKKIAFICPLYDMKNHFDLAFNLFKSKFDSEINERIYFVFSNEEQKEKFRKRIRESYNEEIDYLILPANELHYNSKVTVKKFYALRSLMGQYDFLAIIDSESLFVKKVDFAILFNSIWEKGTCLNANISPDGFSIMRTCFRTLSIKLYHNKQLRKEFGGFRYNIWFNEIPIYKCSTLPSFFKWLDAFDPEGYKNEWNCFEYYIYAAYLVLFEHKHINKFTDIISNGGVMEYLFERPVDEQLAIINKLGTHWSSSKDAITDSIVMLFHLDRTGGTGDYSFDLTEDYIEKLEKSRKKVLLKDAIFDFIPGGQKIENGLSGLIHHGR